MLDMSTLGDAADVNLVIKYLPHTLHVLPFSVTIPATVPQWSEFPEELMNYPVYSLVGLFKLSITLIPIQNRLALIADSVSPPASSHLLH